MAPEEWLKHHIEHTDKRFDKIEEKLDDVLRSKYMFFGGGMVTIFLFNMILQFLIK